MEHRDSVSKDHFPAGNKISFVCVACASADHRRPSREVFLTASQLSIGASVDTGSLENSFRQMDCSLGKNVFLCTECRHKRYNWHIISNPRKYGPRIAQSA